MRKYDKLGGIVFIALGGGIKCRVELSFGQSLKKIRMTKDLYGAAFFIQYGS